MAGRKKKTEKEIKPPSSPMMTFDDFKKNMNLINRSPGFHHIIENIFMCLDHSSLLNCRKVVRVWNDLLKNYRIWLRKIRQAFNQRKLLTHPWVARHLINQETMESLFKNPSVNYNKPLFLLIKIHQRRHLCFQEQENEISGNPKEIKLDLVPYAVWKGNADIVKILFQLLENYAPTSTEAIEDHYIQLAAKTGNYEVLKFLTSLTTKPNNPLKTGRTPISYAAEKGYTRIVKFLSTLTKEPNAPDILGRSPISYAAGEGHLEVIKVLEPLADSDPNSPDIGDMFLYMCIATGKFADANRYVEEQKPPRNGRTPIAYAAWSGHAKAVEYLATLSTEPNAANFKGNTPIHLAASAGHLEVVRILASLTQNPNSSNANGKTPAQLAAEKNHLEIVKILTSSNNRGQKRALSYLDSDNILSGKRRRT